MMAMTDSLADLIARRPRPARVALAEPDPNVDRFDLECAARACGLRAADLDQHLRYPPLARLLHMIARRIIRRRQARLRAQPDHKARAAGDDE